jgi:hypothetical protein
MPDQTPSILPPSPWHPSAARAATILSWSLALVLFYFGLNEIISPQNWIAFAPAFVGTGTLAVILVTLHGIVLAAVGVMLVLNYYRRVASAVLVLLFIEITANLILQGGISDIAIRDFGLLGAAAALFCMPPREKTN